MTKTETLSEIERIEYALKNEPPLGSMIRFTKTFNSDTTYTYVAHHDRRGWMCTRRSQERPLKWHELLDFMAQAERRLPKIEILHVVSTWV